MRNASRLFGCAVLAAASLSCGDVVRQGRSPMYLTLDSLTGGDSTVAFSDVSVANRDLGNATFNSVPKNVTVAPTSNNEVTITRYHVSFRRADGRNTPGVDVPYAFDGAVNALVPATIQFELVRRVAKEESPLAQLRGSRTVITTFADVTFYGKDRVGNDVSVTGTIQVDFGT